MSNIDHVTIDGITYKLTPETQQAEAQPTVVPSTLKTFAPILPKRTVAINPFSVGNYVTVKTPKRPDHRVGQSGKIVAMTPSSLWDDKYMPQVYVEFANSAPGCGKAQGRTGPQHGCRMPVSGLVLANGN